MAGSQNVHAADAEERLIGWGIKQDDGGTDLSGNKVLSVEKTVTLAQLNAGHAILPDVPGRVIKPLGFFIQFNGAFTTADDIRLSDTAGSPVDIVTIAIAQAGNGVSHSHAHGTNTRGAGFLANLTAGKGIQIRKTGSTAAGGTDIKVQISYRIVA
jgi:hypothetical protein